MQWGFWIILKNSSRHCRKWHVTAAGCITPYIEKKQRESRKTLPSINESCWDKLINKQTQRKSTVCYLKQPIVNQTGPVIELFSRSIHRNDGFWSSTVSAVLRKWHSFWVMPFYSRYEWRLDCVLYFIS